MRPSNRHSTKPNCTFMFLKPLIRIKFEYCSPFPNLWTHTPLHSMSLACESMLVLALISLSVTIISTTAQDSIVEYVDGGALLLANGTVSLNDPNPITITIENYKQCAGSFTFCYASAAGFTDVDCSVGFCDMSVHIPLMSSIVATSKVRGDSIDFILSSDTGFNFCTPEYIDGYHKYEIVSLPTQCRVIVKGAKAPGNDSDTGASEVVEVLSDDGASSVKAVGTTTAASIGSSTNTIWYIVGGVVAFLIILIIICIVLAIFVIKPWLARRRTNQRPSQTTLSKSVMKSSAQSSRKSEVYKTDIKPGHVETLSGSVEPSIEANKPQMSEKKEWTPSEIKRIMPFIESVLMSLGRLNQIADDTHQLIENLWDANVVHEVSDLEKILLRAPAEEAYAALVQMIPDLDYKLLKHKAKYGTIDTTDEPWEYANKAENPASMMYRLFAMSYPDIFKGIEGKVEDPVVSKLSVPGLYSLLFVDGFDEGFKKKLIVEMRARAAMILDQFTATDLQGSAFPMHQLAIQYQLDRIGFILGSNVQE